MIKKIYILLLLTSSIVGFSQTKNENLNTQLGKMKKFFLAGDYENYANYTYPKLVEMIGGKANIVNATRQSMESMKDDGFSITSLTFEGASDFLTKGNELQCSFTQVIVMKTPQGTVEAKYTLIGISNDNGQNWTFLDTSGKTKETMLKYFPNLHNNIVIKPKEQRFID